MSTLAKLVVVLGLDAGDYGGGLAGVVRETEQSSSKLGSVLGVGLKIVGGGVAALTGLAATGITQYAGYQKQLNEVFTLLPGITDSAMQDMSKSVKKFATDFGVLPEEEIPALYQAISAGVPSENVFSFLETAQKAAVGGVSDLETAVDGISSTVNAYGDKVISATEASDLMFTAVRMGKTTFDELSSSLFNVNPTAAALGVKFQDVTAALASMTAQGVPTSVATTQLRQLFVELGDSGSDVGKIFNSVSGQSFKAFIASGHSVQDALKLLEIKAIKSGKGVNELFGSVEAGSAALQLTGPGTERFANNLDAMAHSAGATDKAYTTMDNTIAQSVSKLKAAGAVFLITIGERMAPAIGKLLDWLVKLAQSEGAIRFVEALGDAMGKAIDLIIAFGGAIAGIAKQALGWGNNIGSSFASGILEAAQAVVASLQQLGSIIASWLRPGSPPKITPELDKWGAEAATVYMDSWTEGDFSGLTELGTMVKDVLQGLVDTGGMKKGAMLDLLIGSRANFVQGIDEVSKLGKVSQTTFDKIISGLGPVGGKMQTAIRSFFDLREATVKLERAQADLNQVTQKYDAMLAPLNKKQKELQDQEQAIQDTQRLAELRDELAKGDMNATDAALARNEIDQIINRQQIAGIETARDADVSAAQERVDAAQTQVDAAQKQYDSQQGLIQAQNDQNELIKAQTEALTGAAGGASAAAGGMAAMGDAATAITGPLNSVSETVGKVQQSFTNAETAVTGLVSGVSTGAMQAVGVIQKMFGPAIDSTVIRFYAMRDVILLVFSIVQNTFDTYGATITASAQTTFGNLLVMINTVIWSINTIITIVFSLIATFLLAHGQEISDFIAQTWLLISDIINIAAQLISGIVLGLTIIISDFLRAHATDIQNILSNAWLIIKNIVLGALEIIKGILQAALFIFQGRWKDAWLAIQTMSVNVTQRIWTIIKAALDLIANFFGTSLAGIKATWLSNWTNMVLIFTNIKNILVLRIQEFLLWLGNLILLGLTPVKKAFESVAFFIVGTLIPTFYQIKGAISGQLQPALDTAKGLIKAVASAFHDIDSAIKSTISWIQRVADKLSSIEIPSWLQGHSPPPMAHWFDYISEAMAGATDQSDAFNKALQSSVATQSNIGAISANTSDGSDSRPNMNVTINRSQEDPRTARDELRMLAKQMSYNPVG